MAIKERDVVLMGKDGANQTIDLPVTRLGLVEDGAEIKTALADADAVPVVDSADSGQMKKITWTNAVAAIKAKLNGVYAPYQVVSSGDFNSMTTPGLYTMRSASANKPSTGSYYSLWVGKSDNGSYVQQIAVMEGTTRAFMRFLGNTTWSAWKEISMTDHTHSAAPLGRGYGTCSTAAATAAKLVTLSGFVLSAGAVVGVKFSSANTAASPTLNVNSTGAKSIYDYRTYTAVKAGAMGTGVHFFQYSGTYWVLLNPLVTAADTGAAGADHTHDPVSVGGVPIVTTYTPEGGTDGADYAVDVPGVTELFTGLEITVKLHRVKISNMAMTIEVNGLGKKEVNRGTSRNIATLESTVGFLANTVYPLKLRYAGTSWHIVDHAQPVASDLRGRVPVENGGTGLSLVAAGSYLVGNGTGAMQIKTPEQVAGDLDPYLPKGKRTCRFVVGTSTAGWTEADCDYLCDGTDDQVEINAAIQALPEGGGEVVILDGTYNVAAQVSVSKANTKLSGNGAATVLKRAWDSDPTGDLYEGVINIIENGCTVQALYVSGDWAVHTSNRNCGIAAQAVENCLITENLCSGFACSGIKLYECKNVTISQNICWNNIRSGIDVSAKNGANLGDIIVSGNNCYENRTYGIILAISHSRPASCGNISVSGNVCNQNIGIGIYVSSVPNVSITGNACCDNTTSGIACSSADWVSISGNILHDNQTGILLAGCKMGVISANSAKRNSGLESHYASNQYTIRLTGSSNTYMLIVYNIIMGKNYVAEGGTGNTFVGNKYN